jgi:hypothetical protein
MMVRDSSVCGVELVGRVVVRPNVLLVEFRELSGTVRLRERSRADDSLRVPEKDGDRPADVEATPEGSVD